VSFTTRSPLAPHEDANLAPDVYVRNMGLPVSVHDMEVTASQPCEEGPEGAVGPSSCAFTLASAVAGRAEALTYTEPASQFGSLASGRTAMSANGQQIAFVTSSVSNLAGPGTPALQVAVRNLATQQTLLVSVEYDPATGLPIPGKPASAVEAGATYGAVYSSAPSAPPFPVAFANRAYALTPPVGASISADGSTVAWMGRDIYKQARMLRQENRAAYSEPLWRPLAPTRRVTGGSEPESPACAATGEAELPGTGGASPSDPCQGPFGVEQNTGVFAASDGNAVPQLSADGYAVAFVATAPLVSLGANFGRSGEEASDLYLVDMHPGPTRNQALRPLTELASGNETERAGNAPVLDVGISRDGSQIAFTTQRTLFPLGSPAYVSRIAPIPGMAELFDVDLANHTLTRVSVGYEGGPSEHPHKSPKSGEEDPYARSDGALSPSFSGDGNTLAFSSTASNLVFGDGNTPPVGVEGGTGSSDGADIFRVERKLFPQTPVEGYVSSAPPNPSLEAEWRLGVTARSLKDGSVVLYVTVPGAGRLSASAASAVVTAPARGQRARARRRRAGHARARVSLRTVASVAKASSGASGPEELTLRLNPRFRALAWGRGGLSATATVFFSAPGHKTLSESISVSFTGRGKPAHGAKRSVSRGRRR
jgi:hypothetical protein